MTFQKSTRWLLGAVILIAFGLRVHQSGTHGIYLDEKYTLVISQGVVMEGANQRDVFFTPGKPYFTPREFWRQKSISDFIAANIRGDIGNSPSYYAVLWCWTQLVGLSDWSIRFPSVLFSTLLVGLVFVFVRRHFSSQRLALLSAALAAIEPFFIAYSHMARNYSMSFFLTLLATHLFLVLVNRLQVGGPTRALLLAYGLTFIVALLSHYLTLTVFLCHGIYALLFIRPLSHWVPFLVAGVVGSALVSLWFIYGGGSYTFKTLAYQAQFYRTIALTNPYASGFGVVLPATPVNVLTRSIPIWADLFIVSNGLGQLDTLGVRYLTLALVLGLVAAGLLARYHSRQSVPVWVPVLIGLLLVGTLPFARSASLQYVVAAALPSFGYLLWLALRRQTVAGHGPLVVFMLVLALVPTLFLLVMAFRNGHTYGVTQRYSGFSFPYSIILVALMLQQLLAVPVAIRLLLGLALVIQTYYVIRLLYHIYQDRAPKYTYFSVPRRRNPYELAAGRIQQLYAPGDTILYPSIRLQPRDEVEKTYWPYSIQDAQLTNMYLPRQADFPQRMDTTEINKIILLKPSGKRIELINLTGQRY